MSKSFQQLFQDSQRICGLGGSIIPIKQMDTSSIDDEVRRNARLKDGNRDAKTDARGHLIKQRSEFRRLKSLVSHIIEEYSDKTYAQKLPHNRQSDSLFFSNKGTKELPPCIGFSGFDWDLEIGDVMVNLMNSEPSYTDCEEFDEDSVPPHQRLHDIPISSTQSIAIFPKDDFISLVSDAFNWLTPENLTWDIAPTFCFDPQVIDITNASNCDTGDHFIPNRIPGPHSVHKTSGNIASSSSALSVQLNYNTTVAVSSVAVVVPTRFKEDIVGQQKRRGRSVVASLTHLMIANTHKSTKPDLTEVELKSFHRPRLPLSTNKTTSWTISVDQEPKSPGKGDANGKSSLVTLKTRGSAVTESEKQSTSLVDGEFVLIEYVEETPPLIQNIGMASAILNYYRTSNDQQDQDDKVDESAAEKSKRVNLMSTRRLPRHVRMLVQQKGSRNLLDINTSTPRMELGETVVLAADDESPFLGNIEGGELQSAIVNNLFRAPLYPHKSNICDFLLVPVKDKSSTSTMRYKIRSINNVFVCGQLEPQKIAPRPVNQITKLQEKFYLLAAARYFQLFPDGREFSKVQDFILKYCNKEQRSPHKAQHRDKLKAIIRQLAYDVKESGVQRWFPKDFYEGVDEAEGAELERSWSPEELANGFTPEEVCAQESCNAAEYRLRSLGIDRADMDLSTIDMWITRTRKIISMKEERLAHIKRATNRCKDKAKQALLTLLSQNISRELKTLQDQYTIGSYLFESLVIAPWNTTETFVRSVIEKDKLGPMEVLKPFCDPSGRGEGFSFFRTIKQITKGGKKNNERMEGKSSDLRLLEEKDMISILHDLGVPSAEYRGLERWQLVSLFEYHCTKATMMGTSTALQKFARLDGRHGLALTAESFRDACQLIWGNQKRALRSRITDQANLAATTDDAANVGTSGVGVAGESDSDSDGDDDLALKITEQLQASMRSNNDKINSSVCSSGVAIKSKVAPKIMTSSGKLLMTDSVSSSSVGIAAVNSGTNMISVAVPNNNVSASFPRKVVKKITRIVKDDGKTVSEIYVVTYVFSDIEVSRVEATMARKKRAADLERASYLLQSTSGTGAAGANIEELEKQSGTAVSGPSNALSVKFGVLKRKISEAQEQELKEDIGYKPTKPNKRSVSAPRNYRLPRVALAARLEKELLDLASGKKVFNFYWYPVDESVKAFHEIIRNPICLMTVREKIAEFKYSTAQAMLDDVALMTANAERFWGRDAEIFKVGTKMTEKLRKALYHDREIFGAEGDTIKIIEDAIDKKTRYLGRSFAKAPQAQIRKPQQQAVVELPDPQAVKAQPTTFIASSATLAQIPLGFSQINAIATELPFQQNTDDSSGDEEVLEEGQG